MATAVKNKWRGVSDAALGAIVSHPIRCRLLAIFADRVASPNEIAREIAMPVADISYHVRTLREAGVIELVDEQPARGAIEHFYRASTSLLLTDADYAEMSVDERAAYGRLAFQLAMAEASFAMESKKFAERLDHHVSRTPFSVDEEGWQEMVALYRDTLARVMEIGSDSAVRLAENEEMPIRGVAFSSFFELPPRSETATAS